MSSSVYVVHLDRYHLGDPLFIKDLAKNLASVHTPPCIFLHGSGEKAERTLEAEGIFVERENGVLRVNDERQRRLVERSAREVNKEVVNQLTDERVSAVGVQGVDRGLFRHVDGQVALGSIGWIGDLVRMSIVPVVSCLARHEDGTVCEIAPVHAVRAVATHLGERFPDPIAVAFARSNALFEGVSEEGEHMVESRSLESTHVSEPVMLRQLVESGQKVMISTPASFARRQPAGAVIRLA